VLLLVLAGDLAGASLGFVLGLSLVVVLVADQGQGTGRCCFDD
jgi:hypothetical protein